MGKKQGIGYIPTWIVYDRCDSVSGPGKRIAKGRMVVA